MDDYTLGVLLICGVPLAIPILIFLSIYSDKVAARKQSEKKDAEYRAWRATPEGQASERRYRLQQEFEKYLLSIKPPEIVQVVYYPKPMHLDNSPRKVTSRNPGRSPDTIVSDAIDDAIEFHARQREHNDWEKRRYESEEKEWQEYQKHLEKYKHVYQQWEKTCVRVAAEWKAKYNQEFDTLLDGYYYDSYRERYR